MQQSLETMGKMLQTLVESDLGKHATAKGMDPGKFLDETGKELFKLIAQTSKLEEGDPWNNEIKAKLKDIKVEIVSQESDTATISVSGIPDLPDIDELTAMFPGFDDSEVPGLSMLKNGEQEVVKVEGKWIPKTMADGWKDTMSEASEMINNDLKNMLGPEEKKQVMNIMNAAQMGLAGAAKAKTQEELKVEPRGKRQHQTEHPASASSGDGVPKMPKDRAPAKRQVIIDPKSEHKPKPK